MTKICEAYSRGGVAAATPPRGALVSSLSSPRMVLAAEKPWYYWNFRALRTCVKGSYAGLDGITALQKVSMHI